MSIVQVIHHGNPGKDSKGSEPEDRSDEGRTELATTKSNQLVRMAFHNQRYCNNAVRYRRWATPLCIGSIVYCLRQAKPAYFIQQSFSAKRHKNE